MKQLYEITEDLSGKLRVRRYDGKGRSPSNNKKKRNYIISAAEANKKRIRNPRKSKFKSADDKAEYWRNKSRDKIKKRWENIF